MNKSVAIFACGQSAHDVIFQNSQCRARSAKLDFLVTASYSYILHDNDYDEEEYDDDGVEATLQQVYLDAAAKKFDYLVVASTDKIPNVGPYYVDFHREMTDLGIELFACDLGQTTSFPTPLITEMRTLIAEQFAKASALRLRSARLKAQERNRVIGIIPYGYERSAPAKHGCEILAEEAAIVRRVFEAYADGTSPAQIAHDLNADRIPNRRGGLWQGQAIAGGQWRSAGLLRNELYVGRIVYDRMRSEKDPQSGKRVKVLADHPTVRHAPSLRIIDDPLWQRALDLQVQRGRGK